MSVAGVRVVEFGTYPCCCMHVYSTVFYICNVELSALSKEDLCFTFDQKALIIRISNVRAQNDLLHVTIDISNNARNRYDTLNENLYSP